MRIKIPITGTVTDYDPEAAKLDGIGISGDPNDPVRIDVNLGNVSWKLVAIDLENDLAEIEVSPAEEISVLKSGGNPDNPKDWTSRATTEAEKQSFLVHAKNIESKTADEIYALSGSKRLIKMVGVMEKYREAKR